MESSAPDFKGGDYTPPPGREKALRAEKRPQISGLGDRVS
jgi:hypothetical protein